MAQQWLVKRPMVTENGGTLPPESSFVIPYASTITPNSNDGTLQVCTLAGNVTVNAPTNRNNKRLQLVLVQDGIGWRVITFDAVYRVPVDFQPYGLPATYTTVHIFFDAGGGAWHACYPITGMPTS
jgi:hypothetical protein